jgi:hypothetical protein
MTLTIQPEEAGVLEQEVRTWLAHRDELIRQAPGKIVVIKGDSVFGLFNDEGEAYAQAYHHFGNVPLLIRPVQMGEKVYYIGGSAMASTTEEESLAKDQADRSRTQADRADTQHQD